MRDTLESEIQLPATDMERQVALLGPWFHNLHLPDGTQTAPAHPLGDFPSFKWREIAVLLPEDLAGWRVLDVGCNAGFYSFELARRGARVRGIDVEERYLKQAKWAAQQFGLDDRISFEKLQVYDLAHDPQRYDLVLFLGVFYHLRYPLLALDILAGKTERTLIFQSLMMPEDEEMEPEEDYEFDERDVLVEPGWPKMAFVEKNFAGDPTNWWIPNSACIESMLRSAGLRVTERPGQEIYVCEPAGHPTSVAQMFISEQLASATGGE